MSTYHLCALALLSCCNGLTVLSDAGAPGIASDDFNTCNLNPVWTLVDPRGGGSATVAGMGSQDALLLLSVPGGLTHDVWTDGNNAVRVMQAATNGDFEVQVKFQSQFSAGYQMQGLVVEQDAGRFLRFDSNFDGTHPFLFAATFGGGAVNIRRTQTVTPGGSVWLRVNRTGNNWTLSYSADGAAWTTFTSFSDTFVVNRVGVFAGNFSETSAPPFTARVDYFQNTAAPLAGEDGPPQTPPATLTISTVGQGAVNVSPQKAAYYCGETVTLTAQPQTGYVFQGWSGDLGGSNPVATLAMTQSHAVTATFALGPPPAGIVSDDFNTCTLAPRWTVFDPLGGSSVSTVGMGSNDARLRVAIPAGKVHDLWTDNTAAVRVLQAAPNTDLKVQAKFDSALTANYQFQGIDVEADATHLIRFDVDYDGARTSLFAATISGATATIRLDQTIAATTPIWLDVKRVGSNWTLAYSTNGTTWNTVATFTFALAATRAGPYAGTYASNGNAPAFTCLVDYFMNAAQPIAPEDGPPQTSAATLTTNVVGPGTISVSPQQAAYYCNETVTLTATPSVGWTFAGWSGDLSGTNPQASLVMSQSRSVTATFLSNPPPTGIASDDFNTCSLDPRWTVVDPLGGSTVTTTGVGTSDAKLRIAIPAGNSHDLWSDANEAVRVLQAAPNTDFEVQARFESLMNANYQLQGIEVETDLTHFLRFDVDYDGAATSLFAATVSGTSATVRLHSVITKLTPIYLRVKRAGNSWTLSYSGDGAVWTTAVTFTYAMTVARVGPFAGTYVASGNAPAFTCLVDYFMNTASPFTAEDGAPPGPPAILTTSVSGQGAISVTPNQPASFCGETITLTAQPSAGWTFSGWSGDASGSANPLQLAMTASRNILATFSSGPASVQLLNHSLSPTNTHDGEVLRAGYRLVSTASTDVTLTARLIAPGGRLLDDAFRNAVFTVTSTPQWFYRDLLVNLAPNEGASEYGMRWGAEWGSGTLSHDGPGYIDVQGPVPVRVLILMYHYFGPPIDQYWVTPENFRAQLLTLKAHGYTSVTLTDVMNYRAGLATPPAKPVVITTDDGEGSIYTQAYPILADPAIDMKATFFVISSFVDTAEAEVTYVTWDQLAEMEASGHVDVQSHSRSHPHMTTLSPQDALNELVASKAEIETRLSKEVRFICWPYGESNLDTQNAARDAGYFAGLIAAGGVNRDCAVKFDLLRTRITSTCTTVYDPNHPEDYFLTVIEDPGP